MQRRDMLALLSYRTSTLPGLRSAAYVGDAATTAARYYTVAAGRRTWECPMRVSRMVRFIVESRMGVRHWGIDQALHNDLMARVRIPNAWVVPNPDGSLTEAVPQYARDPLLLAMVQERYGGSGSALP